MNADLRCKIARYTGKSLLLGFYAAWSLIAALWYLQRFDNELFKNITGRT